MPKPKTELEKYVATLNAVAYRGSRNWGIQVRVVSPDIVGRAYDEVTVSNIISNLKGTVEPEPVIVDEKPIDALPEEMPESVTRVQFVGFEEVEEVEAIANAE